jgi:hypothetical protein
MMTVRFLAYIMDIRILDYRRKLIATQTIIANNKSFDYTLYTNNGGFDEESITADHLLAYAGNSGNG